jgi:hypothetical protein
VGTAGDEGPRDVKAEVGAEVVSLILFFGITLLMRWERNIEVRR